jgi:purine-nucleoside phosphorylase
VFKDVNFSPCADWDLLQAAAKAAAEKSCPTHIGGIISQDLFYQYGEDMTDTLIDHNVLAVEMEAAALYTLAAKYKVRALAVLTVSDHLKTGESLPSEDRERSFGDMVEIALSAACA